MKLPLHGSNPIQLYRSLNIEVPEHYIDFSVNLNPFGMLPAIEKYWASWLEKITDYPNTDGATIIKLIAEREKLNPNQVLLGNGGAELITLLANFLQKKRVAIVQPTFIEYEKMCTAFQCDIDHIILQEDKWGHLEEIYQIVKRVDALFLCHPNNPTGVIYSEHQLIKLIRLCEEHHCYLIVDEAFYDFAVDMKSVASYISTNKKLIVIRSLTKMYSIAGLRLGYLLGPENIVSCLKEIQPYWSVNAIALEAGKLCVADKQFAIKTRHFITSERERLINHLLKLGYKLSCSDVNYFLLRDPQLENQLPLIQYLLQNGIIPRHTENFRGLDGRWIRLAIKSARENNILLETLSFWKNTKR